MVNRQNQRVELARIPGERLTAADLAVRDDGTDAPLKTGEVRIRALFFGLNAGLKSRLGTGMSTPFGPPIGLGGTPQSDAVGVVLESRNAALPAGSLVVGPLPWADVSVSGAAGLRLLDPSADPLQHLTLLGHVGMTAYAGLVSVAGLAEGETVWISAAAGGVGTCAVQLAQVLGATVIASASGRQRLDFLREELGVQHVVDRNHDLTAALRRCAPEGLDVYFDAVGGDHLRAALPLMRDGGRVVLAGRVGGQRHAPVLENTSMLIRRGISMVGLRSLDHARDRRALESLVARAELISPMRSVATVRTGLSSLPEFFVDLLAGRCIGRGVVDVSQ